MPCRTCLKSPVKILVSNDDGYRAEGIARLREALSTLGEVTVVAPDRNRSGAGNSLTLDVPLRLMRSEPGVYFVAGTPTDCVHLAISGVFDFEFDMVASGINDGANLGDDVLYSGTVAAAIEGRFLGLPALAFSLCTPPGGARHFDTAARVAATLVLALQAAAARSGADPQRQCARTCRSQALAGYRSTRLGFPSSLRGGRFRRATPGAIPVYWIGPAGAGADAGAGHRFQGGREWLRVGDAAVDRPDAPRSAAELGHWLDAL